MAILPPSSPPNRHLGSIQRCEEILMAHGPPSRISDENVMLRLGNGSDG